MEEETFICSICGHLHNTEKLEIDCDNCDYTVCEHCAKFKVQDRQICENCGFVYC